MKYFLGNMESKSIEKALVNVVVVLCIFPFLKLLPIQAETQPMAAPLSLLGLIVFQQAQKPIFEKAFIYSLVIAVYTLVSMFIYFENIFPILLHAASILSPIVVFCFLYERLYLLSFDLMKYIVWIWATLGSVQYFSIFSSIFAPVHSILEVLIGRYNPTSLGETRGVSFFSPEPAAGATSIFLLYVFVCYFQKKHNITLRNIIVLKILLLYCVFLNKSTTIIIYLILFELGNLLYRISKKFSLKSIVIGVFVCISFAYALTPLARYALENLWFENRFFENIFIVYSAAEFNIDTFVMVGGFRFPTLLVGYLSLYDSYGLGFGVGSWISEFHNIANIHGIGLSDFKSLSDVQQGLESVKPYSYLSCLCMDAGLPGIFSLFLFVRQAFRGINIGYISVGCIMVFLIQVVFLGLISLPMPWVVLLIGTSELKFNHAECDEEKNEKGGS